MQRAVQAEFNLAEPPRPPDVADAIAIALFSPAADRPRELSAAPCSPNSDLEHPQTSVDLVARLRISRCLEAFPA